MDVSQEIAELRAWCKRLEDYITNHAETWGIPGPPGPPGPASTVPGPQGDSPTAEEVAFALMANPAWVDRLRGPQGLSGPKGERGTEGAGWPGAGLRG